VPSSIEPIQVNGTSASARSLDFLWLGLTLFVLLTVSFLLPIQPHDYWWYLRVGKDTLQLGAVPTVDTLSFTRMGQPIVYQPWLAAVLLWLAHAAGGATLTFLLRGLIIAAAYGLLWGMTRQAGAGPRLASLLIVLLGLATSNNWSVRPQLFAYPLFVLAFWILLSWHRGQNRYLWALPAIALLWANLHGSFVLMFLLAGTALIFGKGDRKRLTIWLAAALLATLINPRGIGVWKYVAALLSSPSDQLYSVEWRPPSNAGWQLNIFFGWLLLLAPLAASSGRRLSLLEWLWFLGLGWLALSGLRYVVWFMFLMAVYTAVFLSEWGAHYLDPPAKRINPAINALLGALFLLMPLGVLPGVRDSWWKKAPSPYSLENTPIAAAQWLRAHPDLPGPLWGDYVFGGYLTFGLPERPPWIDSRFNAFPPEQWQEYQAISGAAPGWEDLLDQEGINLLMLSVADQPLLLRAVEASHDWCEQYRDPEAVIFSRIMPGESCP
jgi:hypothetical protein